MSRSRRHKHAEHENSERWLLTYADMITLLVAFFMMMYSMSVLNLEKFKQAAIGIRSGFNGPVAGDKKKGESIIEQGSREVLLPPAPMVVDVKTLSTLKTTKNPATATRPSPARAAQPSAAETERERRVGVLAQKLKESLSKIAGTNAARIMPEKKGVAIELIGDLIFFPRGSAELSEEARHILQSVASVLSDLPNELSVEGHTSSVPQDPEAIFASSWELSTARASRVAKYLLSVSRIDPKRVGVTGYGEYRPDKLSKTAPEARTAGGNDRVRVFIYQD